MTPLDEAEVIRQLASPEGRQKVFPMIVDQYMSTWLYRIAINESLDFLRHQKTTTLSSADADLSVTNRLMADDYFDGDKSQAVLQEAIATLPDVQRTVFTLRYYDEMKYSEMSEILGTSEGSLKASYHIAVQKITDYVKRYE